MEAVQFEGCNVVFGADQKDYIPLPAMVDRRWGIVLMCFLLTDLEISQVKESRSLDISRLTFGGPTQPMSVNIQKPLDPLNPTGPFIINPTTRTPLVMDPHGVVVFSIPLENKEIETLEEKKMIWITTVTYQKPLQPIMLGIGPRTQNLNP